MPTDSSCQLHHTSSSNDRVQKSQRGDGRERLPGTGAPAGLGPPWGRPMS
jgi:hypothetical protein